MNLDLVPIDPGGVPRGRPGPLADVPEGVCRAMAVLYEDLGFEEPWIGYLAFFEDAPVGTCGFKSAPRDGTVEIAYFTFPGFEGHGVATSMAAQLVAVARERDPDVGLTARTLPERNASHRVLEKLGFSPASLVEDPHDGLVMEWHGRDT
ncbi:MAG: GNAT family N-acetyltransferase [Gemmatimonadales bacterium]|jgi:RimJ/RimL family protein N-acetyltransferase